MPTRYDNPFETPGETELYDARMPAVAQRAPPESSFQDSIPLTLSTPPSLHTIPYQSVDQRTDYHPWPTDSHARDSVGHYPFVPPSAGMTPTGPGSVGGPASSAAELWNVPSGAATGGAGEPRKFEYTSSPWDPAHAKKSSKRKWIVLGTIIAIIGAVIIGTAVGVSIARSKKGGSSESDTKSGSNGAVKQADPKDPSTFVKNPALHQSFYGMAYTPSKSQLPWCGNSLDAVIEDIQLLSQLTKRIRLYGADCNQTAVVLEAIKRTKVDMQVWLGNYVVRDDNGAAYTRQRDAIKAALQTYGADHVGGITVGNEFMLNYVLYNGGTDANTAIGNAGAAILLPFIQDTRDMLATMGLKIPVGNSDAGSYFNTQVLSAIDYGLSNVHPWFANTTAEAAAGWTASFFKEFNVDVASALSNSPKMYIAETGWPTKSSDKGNENNGAAPASIVGLQTFLDTFVCQANTNGTGYFFFEFADEKWKDDLYGGVEGWWGLFNEDRTLKSGLTLPNCAAP